MTSYHSNLLAPQIFGKTFNVPNVLYETRYSNQDDFIILICGGCTKHRGTSSTFNDIYALKGPNFECSKFPCMLKGRRRCKITVISSDIIAVGGCNNANRRLFSVARFQNNKKTWFHKTELTDKREYFSICSFKQNFYVIGGKKVNSQTRIR